MSYGVINGLTGSFRLIPARTKLAVDSIVASHDLIAGATPDTFIVQILGLHQIDLNINLSSPNNNLPFTLELWNVTKNSSIQSRSSVVPGQAFPSDMYFGFEWTNASVTDEYAFYITPDPGVFYKDYAILLQNLNWRAVVQEFAGGIGSGTPGKIAKWSTVNSLADSIMTEAATTITVAGAVSLNGTNTTTFVSWSDGQNVPVSAVNTGRMRYNNVTHVFEVSENGGAWHDLVGVAIGTVDTVAKFTGPNNVGDSNITSTPTAVAITQASAAGGSPTGLTFTGGAHTALAAGTEDVDVNFNLNRTVQFATGGIAAQRAFVVQAPTYAFVGASTIATAATLTVTGPPLAGLNAAITRAYSLWVPSGTAVFGTQLSASSTGTPLVVNGSLNSDIALDVVNASAGTQATASVTMLNDSGNAVTLGVKSSGYTPFSVGGARDAHLIADTAGLYLAATVKDPSGIIAFLTGGSAATNERMRIDNDGVVRFGYPGTTAAKLQFANATNANLVTLQSGVTAPASYTLTLPLAQGALGTVLTNDGTGVLSWEPSGTVAGAGTINKIPKWSAITTLTDSSLTDNGTNITGALPIRLGPTATPPDRGDLFEAVYSAPAGSLGASASTYSAAQNPSFRARRARGTSGAPAAVQTDDVLGSYEACGYQSGGSFPADANVRIRFIAAENYTGTAQGSYLTFETTAIGATAVAEVARFSDAGALRLGVPSAKTGQLVYANATNANTVTIQSGVTTAGYTLTIPLAQGGVNTFLRNDGSGVLSWAAGGASGTGTVNVIPKVTNATGPVYGDSSLTDIGTGITQAQVVGTSGSPTAWTLNAAAHTTLAGAECIDVNYNLARTVQFAVGGVTTQRAFLIQAPTYAFLGDNAISEAATMVITGAPIAGLHATLLNSSALWIPSGTVHIGLADYTSIFSPLQVTLDMDTLCSADLRNLSNGTSAAMELTVNNDFGSVLHLGIRGSNYVSAGSITSANDALVFVDSGNAAIGGLSVIKLFTGAALAVNERARVTATGLRIGLPSTTTGQLVYANATNANTVTIQSGVTTAGYTLTIPTAQGGANTFLRNDGAGVLSWAAGGVSGTGTLNVIPKVTNATGPVYGDSSLTDNGTNITGLLPIRLGPTAVPADFGSLFEAVYSAPTKNIGVSVAVYSNTYNPNYSGRRARGTSAVPLPVLSGDVLSGCGAVGYHSGGAFPTSANAKIQFSAAENFTAIAQGTNINFWVTPIGTTTAVEAFQVTASGLVRIGTPTTLTGQIAFANLTNANLVTLQSGVTGVSYTMTLPTAQGGAAQSLINNGAGVLSWVTPTTGSGTLNVIPKITNTTGPVYGDSSLTDIGTGITQAQTIATSGSPAAWTLTAAAHTTLAAGTECPDVNYDLARTVQFATGAIAAQRAFVVQAPTYAFVAASVVTTAATMAISGPPLPGLNATLTNSYALWVQSGTLALGTSVGGLGVIEWHNPVNSNDVIIQSGTTAVSYTLTLPTAQAAGVRFLENDGAGNLSWASALTGSGTLSKIPRVTNATGPVYGDSTLTDIGTGITQGQTVGTSGSPTAWTLNAAAHTTLAAGTECPDVNYNLARTVQFATGAIATQRAFVVQAPTYAFVAASVVTNAATLAVTGAPALGANATFTNAYALWVQSSSLALGTSGSAAGTVKWLNATNSNVVTIQSGVTSGSYTLTLPTAQGGASQALINDGAGNLSWVTPATGSGTLNLIAKVTNATGPVYGDSSLTDIGTGITQTQTIATTGSPKAWTLTAAAHTTLAAGTEAIDVNYNLARTVQFATGGIAAQRAFVIQAPTYAFVAASVVTTAATMAISGPPLPGLNATLTNSYALWVQTGKLALGTMSSATGILEFHNATNGNDIQVQAGVTSAAYVLTLPTAQGGSNTFLRNDGAGVLSWAAGGASGTGTLNVIPKVTNATGPVYGDSSLTDIGTGITQAQTVASSGAVTAWTLTAAAHTAQTAGAEVIDVNFNLARTVQHATGAIATQRAFVVQAPTYSFVAASTVTNAATVAITNAPQLGANATFTNAYALWVQAGKTQFDGIFSTGSGVMVKQVTKTSDYPITTSDNTIWCDPTVGGTFTVTLPSAVGIGGQEFTVKHIGTANSVNVASAGGVIDGSSSWTLAAKNSMTVRSDGTNWYII